MAIQTNKTSIQLDEYDREFIDYLKNRVNAYGQLPYNLNEQMAIELIKESAKWFYQWYTRAVVQNLWGLIEKKEIANYLTGNGSKPLLEIATFSVKLPVGVEAVLDVYERGSKSASGYSNSVDAGTDDFTNSMYASSSFSNTYNYGINNNLYVIEKSCKLISNNVYESCTSRMVSYSYDRISHDLTINDNINQDIIIRYDERVHLKYLYQDDMFRQYVLLKCYKEMRRIVGGHSIELPSGVSVNVDELYNYDDIEKIEEQIKSGSGIGDQIIWRQ